MASTIIEQIYENVKAGARLPACGGDHAVDDAQMTRIEERLLELVDSGLREFVERALARPSCQRVDADQRRQIARQFAEVAATEFGVRLFEPRAGGRPDPRLNHVIATLENLPSVIESRVAAHETEIVERLKTLAMQIRDLPRVSVPAPPSEFGSRESAAADASRERPAQPATRVPIDDIQSMIDSLIA